jgi:hypothetical protein
VNSGPLAILSLAAPLFRGEEGAQFDVPCRGSLGGSLVGID